LYEFFSNFGRSLARPLAASGLALIAAAAFFLSQTDAMQRELALQEASYLSATVQTAKYAISNRVPCYSPPPTPAASWRGAWPWWRRGAKIAPPPAPNESQTGGLTEPFRSQTGARDEALHLAFRNAFVVLDGSAEAEGAAVFEAEAEGEADPGAAGGKEGPADRSVKLRTMIAAKASDAQAAATVAGRPRAGRIGLAHRRPRIGCSSGSSRM